MIARLRRRMTVLVGIFLLLVNAGIIFAINYMNWRHISGEAREALTSITAGGGTVSFSEEPPQLPPDIDAGVNDVHVQSREDGEIPPEIPDGIDVERTSEHRIGDDSDRPEPPHEEGRGRGRSMGQPPENDEALISLSNYYVVNLTKADEISSWTSDREELYTDELVEDMAQAALETGKRQGRIGTQFYRLTSDGGKKTLVVLDRRLEIMSARRLLRNSAIITTLFSLVLWLAAYFLIRAMIRPVQDAFARQKQFVSDASHELKTPLAVIGANAQVLEGEIGENECLSYIHSEVKRTSQLVGSLLTLARMDQGAVKASFEMIDLGKTVEEVVLPFESTAFEEGKILETDIAPGVMVKADRAMIAQLTVILLGNAFAYADEHGTIRVRVCARGKHREISVSNTGAGIPEESIDRIFDRFYRAESSHSRQVEGSGLGLAIARNIVDIHHGKIQVSSEPGKETVFTVTLKEQ